ncbi:UDP-glycosyltransferase 89B1-like [Asparagus officinalis]|uniref:UDP-glycosyltransferase 89B1-like n=1 Tax=Asparagus officinalis TaxID=4686 RepID=UPI00098E6050|nr:UDP-glycosyltransferase 89B1-like [Asparagus officinalis]
MARPPHILVVPYPAQGHMLPLLSHRHGLAITVAVTTKNLPLLSPLLSSSPSIEPLVLPFPNYPSLPPGVENTKDVPHSVPAFFRIMHALSHLHGPILAWPRSAPNPPAAIVSDFFAGWTVKLAEDLGVPRIAFCPSGALALSITNCLWRDMPEPGDVSFEALPGSPVYRWDQLSTLYRGYVKGDPLSKSVKEGFVPLMASPGQRFFLRANG